MEGPIPSTMKTKTKNRNRSVEHGQKLQKLKSKKQSFKYSPLGKGQKPCAKVTFDSESDDDSEDSSSDEHDSEKANKHQIDYRENVQGRKKFKSENTIESKLKRIAEEIDRNDLTPKKRKSLNLGVDNETRSLKNRTIVHDDGNDDDDDGNDDDDDDDGSSGQESDTSDQPEGEEATEKDEYDKIKKELSTMTLEEIIALKERLGTKVYNQVIHSNKQTKTDGKNFFKRENKNRPVEMSSKKPVSRYREVIQVKKRVTRDPRFDDLSGNYNEAYFKQAYSFLDGVKEKEKKKVEKVYQKETDPENKKNLKFLLYRMKQQEVSAENKLKNDKLKQKWKQKVEEQVKEGKTPFYLKKADKRKLELAEKFKELKKSGKMDKYLKKKRKKNAQKEKKRLFNQKSEF